MGNYLPRGKRLQRQFMSALSHPRNPPVRPAPSSASDAVGSPGESGSRTSGTLLCVIE